MNSFYVPSLGWRSHSSQVCRPNVASFNGALTAAAVASKWKVRWSVQAASLRICWRRTAPNASENNHPDFATIPSDGTICVLFIWDFLKSSWLKNFPTTKPFGLVFSPQKAGGSVDASCDARSPAAARRSELQCLHSRASEQKVAPQKWPFLDGNGSNSFNGPVWDPTKNYSIFFWFFLTHVCWISKCRKHEFEAKKQLPSSLRPLSVRWNGSTLCCCWNTALGWSHWTRALKRWVSMGTSWKNSMVAMRNWSHVSKNR